MKTLFLMRHAKSDWKDKTLADFDRPLNERGRQAAPLVADFLLKRKIMPDLILSSPAERARQTTLLVIKSAGFPIEPIYDKRIYEASVARLIEVISSSDDTAGQILLVGHNPALSELVSYLTGQPHHMTTASIANITLDAATWRQIKEGNGRLEWLVTPGELTTS